MNQYGINIETLGRFITRPTLIKKPWGTLRVTADTPEFRFERWALRAGKATPFATDAKREAILFVEEGCVAMGGVAVDRHCAFTLVPKKRTTLRAQSDSVVYVFRGSTDKHNQYGTAFRTTDCRDKYWGTIETIMSREGYAAKRMLVKKGCAASLEFHCRKLESYFIHSGTLLLRLRAGRGEDRFFEMQTGESALIPPGLMHQRGGIEDAVIIEISTKDEDSDSFLVEDGAKHAMPHLRQGFGEQARPTTGKKICFDIDGVLCNQVEGLDYREAKPNKNIIALVNKLYDAGHTIYLYTARFMGRNKNDWKKTYKDGYDFTKKQIEEWGVKHHGLFLGKPNADIYIDDRALFYTPDLARIEEAIEKLLN